MIKDIPFRARARTVDHLGREQIADCPTAVSELWKNAFDAYAKSVELNVFPSKEGGPSVAVLHDDGHGMSVDEFVNKWLVVGTESKAGSAVASKEDRNGLSLRPRQGQKGIGRLSCANLGPLLLLVSKRRNQNFVASLIDWRIFENPYLFLSDIRLPVTEFQNKQELFESIPGLVEKLCENVGGVKNAKGADKERNVRVVSAWKEFDKAISSGEGKSSVKVLSSLGSATFSESHIENWPVWSGESEHGTAMLISELNYDLMSLLKDATGDDLLKATKAKFKETLSHFIDPFSDASDEFSSEFDFDYAINVVKQGAKVEFLSSQTDLSTQTMDSMEHVLTGSFNEEGVFLGRVKAFGEWREDFELKPPKDLSMPKRSDSKVGSCHVYIASMEFNKSNTTHSEQEFRYFQELAENSAGFMVFRDGLRVMPYGRVDNDFFEVEERRSKNAGREYWNKRQMFGRIALSRAENPNLRDKAGREGFIDNKAAKTLKVLIANLLMQTARQFFGSASDLRQELLPDIQETNRKEKAEKEFEKQKRLSQKRFRAALNKSLPVAQEGLATIQQSVGNLDVSSESELNEALDGYEEFKALYQALRLPKRPPKLGTAEKKYREYKSLLIEYRTHLSEYDRMLGAAVERLNPKKPEDVLAEKISRIKRRLSTRTGVWRREIDALQSSESKRIDEVISDRGELFSSELMPLTLSFERKQVTLREALEMVDFVYDRIDSENADLFESYIYALQSLSESIDLQILASFGTEKVTELTQELERLNGLAQMGIALELAAHDLADYDHILGGGLKALPDSVKSTKAFFDIEFAREGLTSQLKFLAPLQLSGQRIQKWVSGKDLFTYFDEYFGPALKNANIKLSASKKFQEFKVYEQPSRLYPVFINLINNSRYWLAQKPEDREILLDVVGKSVVVADNGPGVDEGDIESLFTLFFTRKSSGGRGVGLYLAKANLAAGRHQIRYVEKGTEKILCGANFAIDFVGAEYGTD